MSFFLAQMTEGAYIAMAAFIVDFQRLHDAYCVGGFVRLIAQAAGACRWAGLPGERSSERRVPPWTATMGVHHMRQGHRPFLTHIGHKALPHLPGSAHISHGPVQGSRSDYRVRWQWPPDCCDESDSAPGPGPGYHHRQGGKDVAGKLPFMPQEAHVKPRIVRHQYGVLEQGVDLWQERGKERGPDQHRVGNAMHCQSARVHRPLRMHQGFKTGDFADRPGPVTAQSHRRDPQSQDPGQLFQHQRR